MSGFRSHMETALAEARAAGARGEVPVGAVVVAPDGRVLSAAGNRTRELNDPTAHAEVLAIRAACAAAGTERLPGHDLYVTLEPCPIRAKEMAARTRNPAASPMARGSSPIRNATTRPRSMTVSARGRQRGS